MAGLFLRAWRRLRREGVRSTLAWLVGRGVPLATGVPLLSFGRVTPALFVGSQHGRLGLRWLAWRGITHVVSLREEFDDATAGLTLAGYCHLPTVDCTAPTLEHLRDGVAFIREAVSQGGRVYVHCRAGVGRAPTLAIAYLLSEGHTLIEAIGRVGAVRPFIQLEPEQVERLEEFAALLGAMAEGAKEGRGLAPPARRL